MRFASGIAAGLFLAASAGTAAAEDCVPAAVVRAIGRAERVRIVQLGPPSARRAGPHEDAPGVFVGHARLESLEIGGRVAGRLVEAFAKRDRYVCDGGGAAEDFGGERPGVLGVEFDTPDGQARILIELPDGRVTAGFASGVRYPSALSEGARRDWWRFLDEYTRERRSNPGEFLAEMVSAQPRPDTQRSSAAGTIVDDETGLVPSETERTGDCRLPAFGAPNAVHREPVPTSRVAPAYPDNAREAGIDGTVILHALVDCEGAVRDLKTKKSIPMLDKAATAAVWRWRFTPAVRGGKPVACWTEVPVKFSLH